MERAVQGDELDGLLCVSHDGQTDRQTDRQMDRQADRQMDIDR